MLLCETKKSRPKPFALREHKLSCVSYLDNFPKGQNLE